MKLRLLSVSFLFCAVAGTGCQNPSEHQGVIANQELTVPRPEQVLDFETLYGQNCAGCHGAHGQNGAAISLANPVYLATVGSADLQRIVASGVPGTAMPPFGKAAGGMLTDQQIQALTQGMIKAWADSSQLGGQKPPAYASTGQGDAVRGQTAFSSYCGRCHSADGTGNAEKHLGSLVDPSYLALISDQGLRSIIIGGQPAQGMPDWRSEKVGSQTHALSDQEITDIVAWLASHRVQAPGQVYQQHP